MSSPYVPHADLEFVPELNPGVDGDHLVACLLELVGEELRVRPPPTKKYTFSNGCTHV